MRIATECPKCFAELQIPKELAGKTIKCPECGGHVRVPGGEQDAPEEPQRTRRRRDEEPEDDSRKSTPRPRHKSPRDDEDRPRRWKAKSRKKSGGQALWIALGIVFLLVITAGAIVLVKVSNKNTGDTVEADGSNPFGPGGLRVSPRDVNRPPRPAGWVDFHHPNSLYWVYVPEEATPVHSLVMENGNLKRVPTEDGFSARQPNVNGASCHMHVSTLSPEVAQEYKTGKRLVSNDFQGPTLTTRQVIWGGETATEVEVGMSSEFNPNNGRYYMRWVILDNKMYKFIITHNGLTTPTDAERKAFFDSVVFGKK